MAKNNSKIILGLVGKRASGKDVVSRYLKEKYSVGEVVFSGLIKDVFKVLRVEAKRENFSWFISNLRKRFGEGLLVKVAYKKALDLKENIIIFNCIRKKEELKIIRGDIGKNFILVSIESSDQDRFERVAMREKFGKEKKDETKLSLEEFLEEEKGLESENEIEDLQKVADYTLLNNSNAQDLQKKVDELMKKLELNIDYASPTSPKRKQLS